ncbi:type II toxin-antitoxin system RelE/ParE family toxin [Massilia sp. CCM 9210]|uniref:type II toxin-antitoxin system RelE/ParE family toxin n=1 Tax=Massilia scottii TaxID=3057166 RepID=UPI0027968A64|nr:type II toxin-antitoxin system RelE/ParE family toxin [Massilia sp. CCM 9210]MDQ1814108.1 type II toxin-antitoxin system RelE/ParE family toxin [Massilia sp. CCM 9210]
MQLDDDIKDELLAAARAIEIAGPKHGRPLVDTLKQSAYDNMKEIRFTSPDGTQIWRAAFAFDPERRGVILAAANKQGKNEKLFYKKLTALADARFGSHLKALAKKEKEK